MKGKSRACDEDDDKSSLENTESAFRDSAVSSEGTRAKSPPNSANCAVSQAQRVDVYDPNAPQASLASAVMSQNGRAGAARSPSPVIADRSKNTIDSDYAAVSRFHAVVDSVLIECVARTRRTRHRRCTAVFV